MRKEPNNNPRKLHELSRLGLSGERLPVQMQPGQHNSTYMRTKKDKLGHMLNL